MLINVGIAEKECRFHPIFMDKHLKISIYLNVLKVTARLFLA